MFTWILRFLVVLDGLRVSNWPRIVWAVGQTHSLVGGERLHSDDGDGDR